MFSNFLYFLVALVVYTSSALFDASHTVSLTSVCAGLAGLAGFWLICQGVFRYLARPGSQSPGPGLDLAIDRAISRLSILALLLFAVDVYGLKLPELLLSAPGFRQVPTLGALVFLGWFLLHLVIIWNAAFNLQKTGLPRGVTRKSYLLSNISFSLPTLLPWVCLSLFSDLIPFLPWEPVRVFLSSTAGEAGYISLFLVGVSVFGPVVILKLWGCRPLGPGQDREWIQTVCQRAGLKYADILQWDLFGGTMITAGVMGLLARFRYILVTPALLSTLTDAEVEAVILHEIGHVQRYHMVFYLVFFAGFVACNFVLFEPLTLMLYTASPLFQGLAFLGIERADAHPILICLCLVGGFVIYFRYGFGMFMRNFERQADLHIFKFQPTAWPMISTFYKIASYSRQAMDRPNWHHFSIGQRIRFLELCQKDPDRITRHHARVKKMILGYFLIILVLFSLGYAISFGPARKGFERYMTGKILAQQLAVDPDNADLYVFVGDYYYNEKDYARAVDAYENVLRIDPDNIHALNNLAWLRVTCPDERFKNSGVALELAQQALQIQEESYLLDTLAEALAANHRYGDALNAAVKALAQARDKLDYYQQQVRRFEELKKRGPLQK